MAEEGATFAVQLDLFERPSGPRGSTKLASPEDLTANSTLDHARWWFRGYLETHGHPPNTVASYTYDLAILEAQVGDKALRLIDSGDITQYLASAKQKSTRKRRLTSVREFWAYLIREKKVLSADPTERFFPERIHLKTPIPLFETDRVALYEAAREDGVRSVLMVYLMLELGVNRTELLALRREHFDLSSPGAPVVHVNYDDPRWRHKDRRLRGDQKLTDALAEYLPSMPEGDDRLFPMLPQVVNAILNRLVKKAKLDRTVTPQTLRDTFGVDQARQGKGEDELLAVLGLASDPRNRDSVRRYIKLAQPPAEVLAPSG